MKQTELVKAFVNGATQGEAKSLHLVGDQLIHYNTPIAERHGGKIILNYTRHSLATGKVQKMITDPVPSELLIFVKGVEAETRARSQDSAMKTKSLSHTSPWLSTRR